MELHRGFFKVTIGSERVHLGFHFGALMLQNPGWTAFDETGE